MGRNLPRPVAPDARYRDGPAVRRIPVRAVVRCSRPWRPHRVLVVVTECIRRSTTARSSSGWRGFGPTGTSTTRSTSRSRPTPGSTAGTRRPRRSGRGRPVRRRTRSGSRSYEDLYGEPYEPIAGGFWPYGPDTRAASVRLPAARPTARSPGTPSTARPTTSSPGTTSTSSPGCTRSSAASPSASCSPTSSGTPSRTASACVGATRCMPELQADCFAGAWTGDVEAGQLRVLRAHARRPRQGRRRLPRRSATASAPSAQDPAAHGTGFDRIGAFSEGYEQGLERCAEYPDLSPRRARHRRGALHRRRGLRARRQPPARRARCLSCSPTWRTSGPCCSQRAGRAVEPGRRTGPGRPRHRRGDVRRRGVLRRRLSARPSTASTTTRSTSTASASCPALNEIGDYAVATELARQYAYAAQVQLGSSMRRPGLPNLQADCYAGLYAFERFPGDRRNRQPVPVTRRPRRGRHRVPPAQRRAASRGGRRATSVGTAFQRFDAYRSGFVEGVEACEALLEG